MKNFFHFLLKNKSKSLEILNKNKNNINEEKVPVLFIVNNFQKNFKIFVPLSSNADFIYLSFYPKEKKSFIFSFIKVIYLDYLRKYKNQIDEVLNEDFNIKYYSSNDY